MKILRETWSEDGVTFTLYTEGDDGERLGPETFSRRVGRAQYDDGSPMRDVGGALVVRAEDKDVTRAEALQRHTLAHEQRALDMAKNVRKALPFAVPEPAAPPKRASRAKARA